MRSRSRWCKTVFVHKQVLLFSSLCSTVQASLQVAHDRCLFAMLGHTIVVAVVVNVTENWNLRHSLLRIKNLIHLHSSACVLTTIVYPCTSPTCLLSRTTSLLARCCNQTIFRNFRTTSILLKDLERLWTTGTICIPLESERSLCHLPTALLCILHLTVSCLIFAKALCWKHQAFFEGSL